MSTKITVMFYPMNMVGPINAAIGMAEILRDSGHRVVFAVKNDWSSKLEHLGFDKEIIGEKDKFESKGSAERNATDFRYLFESTSRLEKMKIMNTSLVDLESEAIRTDEPFLEEIVKRVRPDVILIDNVFWIPSLMGSGIPWVLVMTCNPLAFEYAIPDEMVPPPGLGIYQKIYLIED